MACLRREALEGRLGTMQCDEEGCELRYVKTFGTPVLDADPSKANCVLQLRLRAGDAKDSGQRTEAEEMYTEAREAWTNGVADFDWQFPTVQKYADHFGFDNTKPRDELIVDDDHCEYGSVESEPEGPATSPGLSERYPELDERYAFTRWTPAEGEQSWLRVEDIERAAREDSRIESARRFWLRQKPPFNTGIDYNSVFIKPVEQTADTVPVKWNERRLAPFVKPKLERESFDDAPDVSIVDELKAEIKKTFDEAYRELGHQLLNGTRRDTELQREIADAIEGQVQREADVRERSQPTLFDDIDIDRNQYRFLREIFPGEPGYIARPHITYSNRVKEDRLFADRSDRTIVEGMPVPYGWLESSEDERDPRLERGLRWVDERIRKTWGE